MARNYWSGRVHYDRVFGNSPGRLTLLGLFLAAMGMVIVDTLGASRHADDWPRWFSVFGFMIAAPCLIGGCALVIIGLRRSRAQARRESLISKGHCTKCGYDLRGNESGACSECGEPVTDRMT